jgi:hypothetical protein
MRICSRCRNRFFPRRARPSWRDDMHRSAAKGMATSADPRAEKIKRRKERRSASYMVRDTLTNVKLIIRGLATEAQRNPDDEECADCQALNRKVA